MEGGDEMVSLGDKGLAKREAAKLKVGDTCEIQTCDSANNHPAFKAHEKDAATLRQCLCDGLFPKCFEVTVVKQYYYQIKRVEDAKEE